MADENGNEKLGSNRLVVSSCRSVTDATCFLEPTTTLFSLVTSIHRIAHKIDAGFRHEVVAKTLPPLGFPLAHFSSFALSGLVTSNAVPSLPAYQILPQCESLRFSILTTVWIQCSPWQSSRRNLH